MRQAVRAIILHDGNMLVMHRNKFGKEYDTLPGGGVEPHESLSEALAREIYEEITIQIADPRLVFIDHAGSIYGDQYVFVCKYLGGEPQLHPESTEAKIDQEGQNRYHPMWIAMDELESKPFVSPKLKQHLLQAFEIGWPDTPIEF